MVKDAMDTNIQKDTKDILTLPPPISKTEFIIFATYFNKIDRNNLDIEYKAYQGFREFVDDKYVSEFFDKGYMTVGDWRLHYDLEIGPIKQKKEGYREILNCTDGTGYDLPYFDRLQQKLYPLIHNPEKILSIGTRHLSDESRTELIGEQVEPTNLSISQDDVVRLNPTRIVRPNIQTHYYKTLLRRKKITLKNRRTILVIKKAPEFTFEIFKLFLRPKSKVWILPSNGDIKIKKRANRRNPRLVIGNRSRAERKKPIILGRMHSLKAISPFIHFLIDILENDLEKNGFELTDEQRAIILSIESPNKLGIRYHSRMRKAKFNDPDFRKATSLPAYMFMIISSTIFVVSKTSVVTSVINSV